MAAPEDHEVRTIANLAQRTGDFADFLQRHNGRAVTERRGGVDHRSQMIGQSDSRALAGSRAARQSVDQWIVRTAEQFDSATNGLDVADTDAVNRCCEFGRLQVLLKPPSPQFAARLKLMQFMAVDRQADIVAQTTAAWARHVHGGGQSGELRS